MKKQKGPTLSWRQIEAKNPVLECFKAGNKISQIFIEEGLKTDAKIEKILNLAKKQNIPLIKKGRKNMARLSQTGRHQGIIAMAEALPEYSLKYILEKCYRKGKEPFLVILPAIMYEYNLGSVVRTAESAGADAVIVNKRTRIGVQATLATMGAIEHLPIIRENLFSCLNLLRNEGIKIVAADPSADKFYYNADLTGPLALIIGSENEGIKASFSDKIYLKIKIPMLGEITSLNLSASAAVILYEIVKQREGLREKRA